MSLPPSPAASLDNAPSLPSRPPAAGPAPRHDVDALRARFASDGRVLIPDFLHADFARRLHERLTTWPEWALVTRIDGQHRAFDAAGMARIDRDKREAFDELVSAEARKGFQYLYERYALYDHSLARHLTDPLLLQVFELLCSESFLALAREVTGISAIGFADGQLTRYRRGHYLTLHDDSAEQMNRVAAFVLNLTPDWAADFGGQLQFVDRQGNVEQTVTPRMNLLTLFAVPAPHLVTTVAPFVTGARFALTGWLRTGSAP